MKLILPLAGVIFGDSCSPVPLIGPVQALIYEIASIVRDHAISILLHPWPLPSLKFIDVLVELIRELFGPCGKLLYG